MATVASQLTRIHDVEGSLTLTSIGGGAGGSANAEIVIQGGQSAGRKQSNSTDHGFFLTVGSQDVSGAGVHVGVWLNHVHYGVLTKLAARLGSDTSNYHEHAFPLSAYPSTGGWVRFWIDVARTPEATSGTFSKTALTQVGALASLPSVSGNAPNLILDASDFTTGGLLLTGTAGVFQDFVAADQGNVTNKYGVVTASAGVIFCNARLTLGSASSLVFNDSGFVVVFPNQSTVAANFMGITVDLQHASTNVDWANGVVRSAGAVKGDLVVTGTAGSFDVSNTTLANLRAMTLTSASTLTGCLMQGNGVVTQAGATISGCSISGSTGSTAVLASNPSNIQGCSFTSAGTGHAIEANTPGTFNWDQTLSGYAGSDGSTGNEAFYNSSGGHITLNVAGGTTPSVRNGSGATTDVVVPEITITVAANTSLVGAEVRIYDLDNNPAGSLGTELTGTESNGSSTFAFSGSAANVVWIQIMQSGFVEFGQEYTIPASNSTFTAILEPEKHA